jgi:hypothetical protein
MDTQGLKEPSSHMLGVGAVQSVQEHNLHQFYRLIQKGETKNVKLCMKLM